MVSYNAEVIYDAVATREADENLVFAASLETIISNNVDIYKANEETAFFAFIKENRRPQPEEYAKIRDINAGLLWKWMKTKPM